MDDYDRIRAEFRWPEKDHCNFAADIIDRWADQDPDKLAMHWVDDAGTDTRMTFADLSKRSCQAANLLEGLGVRRGDTVVIILSRQIAWWELMTACIRAGVVVSPGTTQLSSKDIEYRVEAAQAVAVITDTVNAPKVEAIGGMNGCLKAKVVIGGDRTGWVSYDQEMDRMTAHFDLVQTRADEKMLCYFTSGTTGYPKMTIHTHGYYIGHITTGRYWLDLGPDDLHWNISDTGWAKAAWSSYFAPWLQGAALFVHHTAGFSAEESLAMFARYPITTMCGAPTIYRMFVQQDLSKFSFPHLRHCVGAGEPLNPEVIETWKNATGLEIKDGYGQTETVILCGSFPSIEVKPGSMGKPSPGVDLQVIDSDGAVLPAGEEGDIALRVEPGRPTWLFKEYQGDPERTAACFRGEWYLTGDRAYRDEDGYFWFVSRADDVILSAGYRIGPFEVESALIEHAAVMESAVVSSPDQTRGEIVAAFIVLAQGYEGSEALRKELQQHVKAVTAPYKYPRKIVFVTELPKTVSGKIRRVDLRNSEWSGATLRA